MDRTSIVVRMDISVIVCCFNSEDRILVTLEYLSRQLFDKQWELIVVDNNCTDGTIELAREFWAHTIHVPLTIVKEERPGLSFARERGVKTAAAEILIFCDDDNWLDPLYLQHAYFIMSQDSSIGALGGRALPMFDDGVEAPNWFENVKGGYAVGTQASRSGYVTERGYLWGAGLVLRRTLYIILADERFPFLLSDRKGKELLSGGDAEICARVVILGFQLYYDERLFYYHYIPKTRLTENYRNNLFQGFAISGKVFEKYTFFIQHYVRNRWRLLDSFKWNIRYLLVCSGLLKRVESLLYNRLLSLHTVHGFIGVDGDLRQLVKFSHFGRNEIRRLRNESVKSVN